jgi:hypothetical protein
MRLRTSGDPNGHRGCFPELWFMFPLCNRRQAILDAGEERIQVQPAGSNDTARPIIACGRLTPLLECGEKNQRVWSGEETAVEDCETERDKERRVSPIVCSAAGMP